MRGMIALVIVMTILLFVGLGAVVYGIARNTPVQKHDVMTQLTLPAVSNIQTMSAWQNGVAMYVVTPKGDFLYFIDPVQNQELRVPIKREK